MDPIIRTATIGQTTRQIAARVQRSAPVAPATAANAGHAHGAAERHPAATPGNTQAPVPSTPGQAAPAATQKPAAQAAQAMPAVPAAPGKAVVPEHMAAVQPQPQPQAQPDPAALARERAERELAAMREEAAAQGYEDGLARGEREGRAALAKQTARVAAIAAALEQSRTAVLAAAEDDLVEVVFASVARVLGQRAAADGATDAVRHTLAAFRARGPVTVRVHPEDAALLEQAVAADTALAPMSESICWRPDPGVALGGCIVDGGHGQLDARLETQLDGLRAALLAHREARRAGAGEA
jgi:flagellar assembly protein FliH